jgi:hypothetical protein
MDHNDRLLEHVETLEHQTERLMQYTRTVKRLLHWWRGAACGLAMLHLLSLVLPSGRATYDQKDLEHRVAELEYKLEYVSGGANEVVITGANLRIINGLGSTATTNGLGNLIVGYNEPRDIVNVETGSHNVVVRQRHNFQIPPDLVVKSQVIDITEITLSRIRRPNAVQTLCRNRILRFEQLSTSEAHC